MTETRAVPTYHLPEPSWRPLDPRVPKVWRLGGLLSGLIVLGLTGIVVLVLGSLGQVSGLRVAFVLGGTLGLVLVGSAIGLSHLSYRNWGYAITDDELEVKYGIWWKTRRAVARSRIQHVDISSGPIERSFGLRTLSVYVAGAAGAVIQIPGLRPSEAERIRRILLRTDDPPAL